MKCPVCQNEIEEGRLYCEKCGYEIQIVPEFEAELENNIRENMSELINELAPEKESGGHDEDLTEEMWNSTDEDLEERPSLFPFFVRLLKKHVIASVIVMIAVAAVVAAAVLVRVNDHHKNSYEYQYRMAVQCAQDGRYEDAVAYIQEALRLDANHPEARMLYANYLVKTGKTEDAERIYRDLFNYADYAKDAYEKYISLLEEQERYLEICYCLSECEILDVRRAYNQYLAELPIFSIPEGTYEDAQVLKISANTNGIIYYTTDGTTPNQAANVYTGPIMLESGEYEIKALFINEYGMKSDVFSAVYTITAELPTTPVVTPAGGDYTEPEYITVEVPAGCVVYYTTDGTTPNQDSLTYSREICMPLGNATFCFISYNSDRVASDVLKVEYHLNLDNPRFDDYQAILITAQGLTDRGMLLNMNGEVAGVSGIYTYRATGAFWYNDERYYLMTEYYTDLVTGNKYSTQTRYAVSVDYGVLYKTEQDRNGHYIAVAFD